MALDLLLSNLLSPAVLFFILGILAGAIGSDLEIPDSISRYLGLYLMMAIGFKGGTALAQANDLPLTLVLLMAIGVAFSFCMPLIGFALLRLTRLSRPQAAAIAAHYGSVSLVTFAAASAFLERQGVAYDGSIVAVLALMEGPAIFTGLALAHAGGALSPAPAAAASAGAPASAPPDLVEILVKEVLINGTLLLLAGSFAIGYATGEAGVTQLKPFLIDSFSGVLCLFLLDIGLLVARQIRAGARLSPAVALFALAMPLIGAAAALATGWALGLSPGTGLLFTVLAASASYIAVPAALRQALPEVSPALYLPPVLAVTFPLNLAFGIPAYWAAAERILG